MLLMLLRLLLPRRYGCGSPSFLEGHRRLRICLLSCIVRVVMRRKLRVPFLLPSWGHVCPSAGWKLLVIGVASGQRRRKGGLRGLGLSAMLEAVLLHPLPLRHRTLRLLLLHPGNAALRLGHRRNFLK